MKKLFTLIGVAALLATVSLKAAEPTIGLSVLSVPTILAAGTTNFANPPYVDLSKSQGAVSFASTLQAGANGATNIYYFQPTNDGINYDTNAVHTTFVTNATTVANAVNTWIVALPGGNMSGYRLATIVTTGTSTNGSHTISQKIAAP